MIRFCRVIHSVRVWTRGNILLLIKGIDELLSAGEVGSLL